MHYKYPRTPHLPWSPGASSDDICLSKSPFLDQQVVITEKMDGENTSLYDDGIHARSLDSAHHPSRNRIKVLQARLAPHIPKGWRLCMENCYALHSIPYTNLSDHHLLLSVWDENNICLSWQETKEWAQLFELSLPPILYQGPYEEHWVHNLHKTLNLSSQEGYVIRNQGSFHYHMFDQNVAKWVRKNHVQTDEFWRNRPVVPNLVKRSL